MNADDIAAYIKDFMAFKAVGDLIESLGFQHITRGQRYAGARDHFVVSYGTWPTTVCYVIPKAQLGQIHEIIETKYETGGVEDALAAISVPGDSPGFDKILRAISIGRLGRDTTFLCVKDGQSKFALLGIDPSFAANDDNF